MIKEYKTKKPEINDSCYIDKTSLIIGEVNIEENSSVWPKVVIRGDMNFIKIGKNTNVQDNTTVPIGPNNSCNIDHVVISNEISSYEKSLDPEFCENILEKIDLYNER